MFGKRFSSFQVQLQPCEMSSSDLWSFIKNSKATQSASLEVLREFVLSLDHQALLRILEVYTASLIGSSQHASGLTLMQSVDELITNPRTDALTVVDAAILSQMKLHYGAKYEKQVVCRLQQNNAENEHLLTINAEVFAYSLQFLSFRELCAIQPTCSYFTYITTQRARLAHHFIHLNER